MSLQRFTRKEMVVVSPEETARDAAELMHTHHVGAIVVVENERPVGIVTDRDLALRIVAAGRDATTPIRQVMSRDLVVVRQDELVDQALLSMRRSGVRRLPIIDRDGRLVGLVALDDLLVLLSGELSSTAEAVMDNRGP